MAKNFIFQRRMNDVIETFYPKTTTDNVVKVTSNGEEKLEDVLEKKGGFLEFTEQTAEDSTNTDIMFDVLDESHEGETIDKLKGTVIGDTPPDDTNYLWIDNSGEKATVNVYDSEIEDWKVVRIAEDPVELESDIEE